MTMTCIETAHTPGPWDYDMEYIVAPDPGGRHPDIYIAEIAHSDDEGRIASPRQQDANRRLIAAAPELLEALQHLLAVLDTDEQPGKANLYPARDAIAKATAQDCDWR
jgi:hypothetical protein